MSLLQENKTPQLCRWHYFTATSELEQAALDLILSAAKLSISDHGAFHIVLAGGTTPRKIYEALRNVQTDWHAWHVYFGDERCLPIDHVERNSHMAEVAWLSHVAIPETQIHAIPAQRGATIAAERYAQLLNKLEFFDLVLLGLGEDGHTASLFPGHDAGNESDSAATLTILDAPKPPPQRVSLSARRLSLTKQVIFLVTGSSKKQAVSDWQNGVAIPASKITPENGVDILVEAALFD